MPHQAIRLKYLFYKLFIFLRLPSLACSFFVFLSFSFSLSFSHSFVHSHLSFYLFLAHRTSEHRLLFLFHPDFPAVHIFSSFLPLTPLPHATSIYPPFLLRAHFSPPTAAAESSHHSAAHKGGLRAPVSSTYDPNSAPYFFERLEKHAVTAVRVIACAQGASRLSVRRGRHVGYPWMTRWDEPRVQSMNKVSDLINCKLSSSMKSCVFLVINFVKNDIISNKGYHFCEINLNIKNYYDN